MTTPRLSALSLALAGALSCTCGERPAPPAAPAAQVAEGAPGKGGASLRELLPDASRLGPGWSMGGTRAKPRGGIERLSATYSRAAGEGRPEETVEVMLMLQKSPQAAKERLEKLKERSLRRTGAVPTSEKELGPEAFVVRGAGDGTRGRLVFSEGRVMVSIRPAEAGLPVAKAVRQQIEKSERYGR